MLTPERAAADRRAERALRQAEVARLRRRRRVSTWPRPSVRPGATRP